MMKVIEVLSHPAWQGIGALFSILVVATSTIRGYIKVKAIPASHPTPVRPATTSSGLTTPSSAPETPPPPAEIPPSASAVPKSTTDPVVSLAPMRTEPSPVQKKIVVSRAAAVQAKARNSFILGVMGLMFPYLGIIALIFGYQALKHLSTEKQDRLYRLRAKAGIALGWFEVFILLAVVLPAMLAPS